MARPLFQRVIKNGNSLVVVLPAEIVRGLEVQRGDLVQIEVPDAQTIRVRLFTSSEEEQIRRKGFLDHEQTID